MPAGPLIDNGSAHRELVMKGAAPLTDPAQIDGVLDPEAPPKRPALLRRIERACRVARMKDAVRHRRWRLSRLQPSTLV